VVVGVVMVVVVPASGGATGSLGRLIWRRQMKWLMMTVVVVVQEEEQQTRGPGGLVEGGSRVAGSSRVKPVMASPLTMVRQIWKLKRWTCMIRKRRPQCQTKMMGSSRSIMTTK
jgi:hypothetical protein